MIALYLSLLIIQNLLMTYESSMNLLGLTKSKQSIISQSTNDNTDRNQNFLVPDGTFDIDFTNKSSTRFHGKAVKFDIETIEVLFGLDGLLRYEKATNSIEFDSISNRDKFKMIFKDSKVSYLMNNNAFYVLDFSKPDEQQIVFQFFGVAKFYDIWIDQIISRSSVINLCKSNKLISGLAAVEAERCNTDAHSQAHLSLSATLESMSTIVYDMTKDYVEQNRTWSQSLDTLLTLQSTMAEYTMNLSIIMAALNETTKVSSENNEVDMTPFLSMNESTYAYIDVLRENFTMLLNNQQNILSDQWNQSVLMTERLVTNLSEGIQSQAILISEFLMNYTSYTTQSQFQSSLIHKEIEYLHMNISNILQDMLQIQTNATSSLDSAVDVLTNKMNVSFELQWQEYQELILTMTERLTLQNSLVQNRYEHSINRSVEVIEQQYDSLQKNFTEMQIITQQNKLLTENSIEALSREINENLTYALYLNTEKFDSKFLLIDDRIRNISDQYTNALHESVSHSELAVEGVIGMINNNHANVSKQFDVLLSNTSAAIARSNSILAKVIGEMNISIHIHHEEAAASWKDLNESFNQQIVGIHQGMNSTAANISDLQSYVTERLLVISSGVESALTNASHMLESSIKDLTEKIDKDVIQMIEMKHNDIDLQIHHLNTNISVANHTLLAQNLAIKESLLDFRQNISNLSIALTLTNTTIYRDLDHRIESKSMELVHTLDTRSKQFDIKIDEVIASMHQNLSMIFQQAAKERQAINDSISEYYYQATDKIGIVNESSTSALTKLDASISTLTKATETQILELKRDINMELQTTNETINTNMSDLKLEFQKQNNILDSKFSEGIQHNKALVTQSEARVREYIDQQQNAALEIMNTTLSKQNQRIEEQQLQTSLDMQRKEQSMFETIRELKEIVVAQTQRLSFVEQKLVDQDNEIKQLQDYNYRIVKDVASVESVDQLRKLLFDLQGSMLVHSSKVLDILLEKHICSGCNTLPTPSNHCNCSVNEDKLSKNTSPDADV